MSEILRRKLREAHQPEAPPHALVDQAWRLALTRALREGPGLVAETSQLTSRQCDLAELPELPPERALVALLDGPGGAMGVAVLSAEVTSSLIEMQTTGRVGTAPPGSRRPTRTDAAMVSPMLDRALSRFDFLVKDLPENRIAQGFRYASLLEDARSIGLLLEDQPFHLISATLVLAGGRREGEVLLALPLTAILPAEGLSAVAGSPPPTETREGLACARCELNAVLAHRSLTLQEVMQLEPGQMLTLKDAMISRISLRGIDGKPVAIARLGQQNGHRALRISLFTGSGAEAAEPGPPSVSGAGPPDPGVPQIGSVQDGFTPIAPVADAASGFAGGEDGPELPDGAGSHFGLDGGLPQDGAAADLRISA